MDTGKSTTPDGTTEYWLVTHETTTQFGISTTTEAVEGIHPLEVMRLWTSNLDGLGTVAILFAMPITKEAYDEHVNAK